VKNVNYTLMGLRGLLALLVVIFHINGSAVIEGYIDEAPKESLRYMLNYAGPISVNLFFVISGYLITQSLLNKPSVRDFAINRFLRIYPVFFSIHLIIFIVGPVIGYKWMDGIGLSGYVIHFISNALLLPGMFDLPIAQIVAWSLSYELFFYVIAAAIWCIYRSTRATTLKKYILYSFMVTICLVTVYYRNDMLYFVVGVVLFFSQDRIKRSWKPSRLFYLDGVIVLAAIYLSYHFMKVPIIVALVLSFLLFVPIIMEYGLLSQFLRTKFMRYLGAISFSLYMWHTMVMFPLKIIVPKISNFIGSSSFAFAIYALLSLVLSIFVAHLSYRCIEGRFTKYLKTKWVRRNGVSLESEFMVRRG